MNSNINNFKCPFCDRQYDSLDAMYNCAKNDEATIKQTAKRVEEERKIKQIKEQESILSQKLEEVNREIDKYNKIVEGTNNPKIEKIYKFNFIKDKNKNRDKNDEKNVKSTKPIINEISLDELLDEIFKVMR